MKSNYESDCERINKFLRNFNNHQITVIHESDKVKRYSFKQPDTGCYGFSLTCADNLIVMTGDCYSLLVEPGYGRDGLAFLRGSINSYGYFLSKCPLNMEIKKYSPERALKLVKEYYKDYLEKDLKEDELPCDFYEEGLRGEVAYWDFCHESEIDDPGCPTVYTGQTLLQIAGLMKFVEEYGKLSGERILK